MSAVPAVELAADAPRVLLVDDNPTNLQVLYRTLAPCGYRLFVARSGEEALRTAREVEPQLVLLDIMMPGLDGYATCAALREDPRTAGVAVLFISALDSSLDKVRGFSLGGVDYVTKPFDGHEVRARVETQLRIKLLERELRERNARLAHELGVVRAQLDEALQQHAGLLLGPSAAARQLDAEIRDLASVEDSVLICGPPGCDPEGVARLIHYRSARGGRAFLSLNAAVRAGEPVEYLRDKLSLARGGTFYVEQVGGLIEAWQRALLDVLDGPAAERPRLICYAPADLAADVVHGRFRAELVGRLARRVLHLPPLAQRAADIPELARHYLTRAAARLERPLVSLSAEALRCLQHHRWPGNLRELQMAVERAVLSAPDAVVEIAAADLAGVRELGGYKLVEKLGEGGMGEVWRARHQLLARPAAVKLIRSQHLERTSASEAHIRFRAEASATAQLRCPHTVELYDFGIDPEGTWYYVMELLDGIDLKRLVERHGPLPAERVVHLLEQACRSLAEAHASGLVHRDVKPANLFTCRMGLGCDVLKVLDFGLVAPLGVDGAPDEGPRVAGTPGYMAPEALTGENPVDHRADLYGLGCVGYYLLAGRHAFEASTLPMLIYLKCCEAPPPLARDPAPPRVLVELLGRCMDPQPSRRPDSALQLLAALRAVPLDSAWTEERALAWWDACQPQRST